MNRRGMVLFAVALALMAATAAALVWLKTHQRLGAPGLKTTPLPGSRNLLVALPETAPGFTSETKPEPAVVTDVLPKDTSYGQRFYQAQDGFEAQVNVVLMGSDRTSIHQPEFCLVGQGWQIDRASSGEIRVPIRQPQAYELPAMKLVATKQIMIDGRLISMRGLYVYWFVAQDHVTAKHWQRMWWMARDLLRTGVLERWAYVSCFTICEPGNEAATLARMQGLIAGIVPQFQPVAGTVGN
jgi:Protein of unknown function (DUF3485)